MIHYVSGAEHACKSLPALRVGLDPMKVIEDDLGTYEKRLGYMLNPTEQAEYRRGYAVALEKAGI